MRRWVPSFEGDRPERAKRRCVSYTSFPWFSTACQYFIMLRVLGWRWNDPSLSWFGEAEGRWFVVVGSALDPLVKWFSWSMEGIRSHWNWRLVSGSLNNSEFSLTRWFPRNALPLLGLNYKAGLADIPNCPRCASGLEETSVHAFHYRKRNHPFWSHVEEWTAPIESKQLVLLDVDVFCDPSGG